MVLFTEAFVPKVDLAAGRHRGAPEETQAKSV
jgi:hypothetical protein